MTLVYAYSRLIMEASKDGIMPPSRYLAKISRFQSPLYALLLSGAISIVYVIGPPPGRAYDFLVILSSYPQWIFYGLSILGLLVMRYTHPNAKRPIKSSIAGNVFFITCCILLTIIPFFPPENPPSYDAPYWLIPTLGTGSCVFFAGVFYWGAYTGRIDLSFEKDIFVLANRAHDEMVKGEA
jgi:amino acid transporter